MSPTRRGRYRPSGWRAPLTLPGRLAWLSDPLSAHRMPAIDRTLASPTFLTEEARDALRRRLHELGGLALILLALMLAIALATWSVRDPSLSHATTTPVRN